MRSIEPGISRFRVWSFGPSRNDGVWRYGFNFQTAKDNSVCRIVIASAAKQSMALQKKDGLLRSARKKVAQKRCHTTNIEPQTFIQGGSVPYPPVPTRNDEEFRIR